MTISHSNPKTDPKKCEACGEIYTPKASQGRKQKYCSRRCKDRAQRKRDSEKENGRPTKGGYPRKTYINLWMRALCADLTVPCHYCGKRLTTISFSIDHKVPMKNLKTREEVMDESNMVISCHDCNQAKGTKSYEEFINE